MAHEFESGFFAGNEPAWHGLGTVIDEPGVNADRAIRLAGLDWEVRTEQLMHKGVEIPNKKVIVRDSFEGGPPTPSGKVDGIMPLGVVSNRYQPFQNKELFEFGDAIVQAHGGAHWYTAGGLRGGRNVWGLIDLGQVSLRADEDIARYVAIMNSHDGTGAIHAIVTNVRIVCQNTWTWALDGAPRKISVRHTGDVATKISEAQRVLGIASERIHAELKDAENLLACPFGQNDFKKMIEVIVPIDDDATDRSKKMQQSKREQLWLGYKISDNVENIRDTKYGALQSVLETSDHVLSRGKNAESRLMSVFDGSPLVQSAHEYLLEA